MQLGLDCMKPLFFFFSTDKMQQLPKVSSENICLKLNTKKKKMIYKVSWSCKVKFFDGAILENRKGGCFQCLGLEYTD